ncbi:MAG: protein phosphatase [Paracoccaceae bacterium]
MGLSLASLEVGGGWLAISPMPGRGGAYAADLADVLAFGPALVLTMTTPGELAAKGAAGLGADLAARGIGWRALPIADFGVPGPEVLALWPGVAEEVRAVLAGGGRVLVHCMGGCGRSGMAVLRLMVEAGEPPGAALARLRAVRPCAVETEAQFAWAAGSAGSAGA